MSHMSVKTLIGSAAEIIARIPKAAQNAQNALLFTVSSNSAPEELLSLTQYLSSAAPETIGCITAPIPSYANYIACSIASFDLERCKIFRSTIPGQEIPQVGRWHSFRKKVELQPDSIRYGANLNVDWESMWTSPRERLPIDLEDISPDRVKTLLYLSDLAPEGLNKTLASNFPSATKLGLIASSTPFITGRPVTLFHNSKIFSDGAIGAALLDNQPALATTSFSNMTAISQPLNVTHSEGNLVVSLNGRNPTQILLAALQKNTNIDTTSPFFKENDEFYLATVHDGKPDQMYTITAGDPARGTISLQASSAPSIGTAVQFYHRGLGGSGEKELRPIPPHSRTRQPSFRVMTPSQSLEVEQLRSPPYEIDDFVAASENGFLLSRGEEAFWTCSVPGAMSEIDIGSWRG